MEAGVSGSVAAPGSGLAADIVQTWSVYMGRFAAEWGILPVRRVHWQSKRGVVSQGVAATGATNYGSVGPRPSSA